MSIQDRDIRTSYQVDVIAEKISQANTISLLDIFRYYNINICDNNRKVCCPLPDHSNDRTPSFFYYPETNSFYCFGCKVSGRPTDLVSIIENYTKYKSAIFILDELKLSSNNVEISRENYHNKNDILEFSHLIRKFIINNKNSPKALEYAEQLCIAFDNLRIKHLNEQIKFDKLLLKINNKLRDFTCQEY